jgi:hypothetical protein
MVGTEHSGFRRSSRCSDSGCVEVASAPEGFLVRDSKLADSPILGFAPAQWADFVAGVRAGEFD